MPHPCVKYGDDLPKGRDWQTIEMAFQNRFHIKIVSLFLKHWRQGQGHTTDAVGLRRSGGHLLWTQAPWLLFWAPLVITRVSRCLTMGALREAPGT